MSKTKVFCFGFGQVAESFINKLINEKNDFDLNLLLMKLHYKQVYLRFDFFEL